MRLALLFGGFAAALMIAEAAVRIFDLRPAGLRGKTYLMPAADNRVIYHCYASNPHGEFRPVPDVNHGEWRLTTSSLTPTELPLSELRKTPWCVEDRSPELRVRDRHYEPAPAPNMIRLAMVGDSFVRGEGVPVEGSLPKQLEALLGTNRFEVVNAGYPGFGTEEEVPVVARVAEKLNTRRVILVFIPNDIRLSTALDRRQEYINDLISIREEHLARHQNKHWIFRVSRVAELAGSVLELRQITQETIQWYLDSYDPAFNQGGLDLLQGNFRTLAKMPNCRVAVVIYPLMIGLDGQYPLAPIHARVRKMMEDAGLPVLDLWPAFKGSRTSDLQVHPADHHPNSKAHSIAARAIQNWLQKDLPDFLGTKEGTPLK
jgi:hypothetical protein